MREMDTRTWERWTWKHERDGREDVREMGIRSVRTIEIYWERERKRDVRVRLDHTHWDSSIDSIHPHVYICCNITIQQRRPCLIKLDFDTWSMCEFFTLLDIVYDEKKSWPIMFFLSTFLYVAPFYLLSIITSIIYVHHHGRACWIECCSKASRFT